MAREQSIDPQSWPEIAYFAQQFRELRTERQWTQRACAEKIGVNQTYIAAIETARVHPTYLQLVKIAALMGHPVSYFLLDRKPDEVLKTLDATT